MDIEPNEARPRTANRKRRSCGAMGASRARQLVLCVLLMLVTADARFARLHRGQWALLPRRWERALPVVRAVDDVGPAVKNATELALAKAQGILTQYSNTLRIVSIPAGLVVTFLGHLLFTPTLFGAGFLTGGGLSFVATRAAFGAATPAAAWVTVAAALLGGATVALLATRLLAVGMFAVGGTLGVVVASALSPSVLGRIYPPNADVGFYAGAVVLGVVLGLVAMQFQRQMVIIATAYGGAFAFFFGIGYFAGHFPTGAELEQAERGKFGAWFVMYALMTILFGSVGALTQFRLANGRPLTASGRARGERGERFGSWWSERNEEAENLPQNESGKEGSTKDVKSFVPVKEVFVAKGDAGGLSENGRFGNSFSVNVVNNVGKEDVVQGTTEAGEVGKSEVLAPEKMNNADDSPANSGTTGRTHWD